MKNNQNSDVAAQWNQFYKTIMAHYNPTMIVHSTSDTPNTIKTSYYFTEDHLVQTIDD